MFPRVNRNIARAPTNNITIKPSIFGWNNVAITSSWNPPSPGVFFVVVVVVVVFVLVVVSVVVVVVAAATIVVVG